MPSTKPMAELGKFHALESIGRKSGDGVTENTESYD
jgi:hypothetical protein